MVWLVYGNGMHPPAVSAVHAAPPVSRSAASVHGQSHLTVAGVTVGEGVGAGVGTGVGAAVGSRVVGLGVGDGVGARDGSKERSPRHASASSRSCTAGRKVGRPAWSTHHRTGPHSTDQRPSTQQRTSQGVVGAASS